MKILAAALVLPISAPPIEGGAVAVGDDGSIMAAGRRKEILKSFPGVPVEEFGDSVILPALVNCHAHLELTSLSPVTGTPDFPGWIKAVIGKKRSAGLGDFEDGLRLGLRMCRDSGQGTIADIASVGGLENSYPEDGPLIAFTPELICPSPDYAKKAVESALAKKPGGNSRFLGIFAHAPYTVCAEAYKTAFEAVKERGLRLFTHVAESAGEVEFCLTGKGGMAKRIYEGLPVSPPPPLGAHPIDWLEANGILGPETVLVHAVHVSDSHIEKIARSRAGVGLCPRSNRNLGVGKAPGRAYLDSGATVALGTDSILSSGNLDLWEEILFAVDDYGWSPEEGLRAATASGAKVLGLAGETGSLTAGLRADIMIRKVGGGRDMWERGLNSGPVERLILAGE